MKPLNRICTTIINQLNRGDITTKEAKAIFAEKAGFRVSARSKDKFIEALKAYSNIRSE